MIVITIIAANLVTLPNPHRFAMTVCRGTIAFAAMLAPLTAMGFSIHASQTLPRGHQLTILTMLFVSAFVIPATYADAIADGLGKDLKERLGSRRFGSAHRMAFQLCQLDPSVRVNDRPVQSVQQELEEIVHDLNQAITQPIQPGSSFADRGQRLTLLMCLDRNSEALSLLEPMTAESDFQPIALDYQGLCHQRLEQYERSEAAYRKSVAFWQTQPRSQRQQNSLASAWKGIGYAMRRLNRRTKEEQAYRMLVEIMPTGENNLLLAQCYREHQKTKLASQHAAIAMELNPNLREQSESVLSSMMMEHFGCLQVPRR